MLRQRARQQPCIKAHKVTGQLGSSADVGKTQLILTGLALTSVSTGMVAGDWHVYNDLTHVLEQLAGSWDDAWS